MKRKEFDGEAQTGSKHKKFRCTSTDELDFEHYLETLIMLCKERYGAKAQASLIRSSAQHIWQHYHTCTFLQKIEHAMSVIHDMFIMYS
jgi:hypothetical protein